METWDAACMGQQGGAYACHIRTAENVCWTEGSGCTTGLYDASGTLADFVPCESLAETEDAAWMHVGWSPWVSEKHLLSASFRSLGELGREGFF